MRHHRLLQQAAISALPLMLLISCASPQPKLTPAPSLASAPATGSADLYYAVLCGYSLGYLTSTYSPLIPEYGNTRQARETYTDLVKASADILQVTLAPDPNTLKSKGRGKDQFVVMDSYFTQFGKYGSEHPGCISNVMGMSLRSGLVILNTFEGETVTEAKLPVFKQMLTQNLSVVGALAGTAAVFCKEGEHLDEFSAALNVFVDASDSWVKRVSSPSYQATVSDMSRLRSDMDDGINALMTIARRPS